MSVAPTRLTLLPSHVLVVGLRSDVAVLLIGNALRKAWRWAVYEVGGRYMENALREIGANKIFGGERGRRFKERRFDEVSNVLSFSFCQSRTVEAGTRRGLVLPNHF